VAGPVIGSAVGGAIGSAFGRVSEYECDVFVLALAERDFALIRIDRRLLGGSSLFRVDDIKAECERADSILAQLEAWHAPASEIELLEAAVEGKPEIMRMPATQVRLKSSGPFLVVELGSAKRLRLIVPAVPDIPDQASADTVAASMRRIGALLPIDDFLCALVQGSAEFTEELWRAAVADRSYWNGVKEAVKERPPDGSIVYSYLSDLAAIQAGEELCQDGRYIELLDQLYQKLDSKQQVRLIEHWLQSTPLFLLPLAERICLAWSRRPFSKWLSPKPYRQLNEWVTKKSSGFGARQQEQG
jgi:hypothetical protein